MRAMYDHEGNQLKTVSLSDAVQITGWKDLPMAGDVMFAVENEHKAHEIIRIREAIKMDNLAVEHRQESDKRLEEHLIVIIHYFSNQIIYLLFSNLFNNFNFELEIIFV